MNTVLFYTVRNIHIHHHCDAFLTSLLLEDEIMYYIADTFSQLHTYDQTPHGNLATSVKLYLTAYCLMHIQHLLHSVEVRAFRNICFFVLVSFSQHTIYDENVALIKGDLPIYN